MFKKNFFLINFYCFSYAINFTTYVYSEMNTCPVSNINNKYDNLLYENIHYLSSLLERNNNATVPVKAHVNIYWTVENNYMCDDLYQLVPYQNTNSNVIWCVPVEYITCSTFPPIHPDLYEEELNNLEYLDENGSEIVWNYDDPMYPVIEDTVYVYRPFPLKYLDIYKINNDEYIKLPLTH